MSRQELSGLDPDVLKRVVTIEADAVHLEKMKHEAHSHGFTFFSDEPARMGGDEEFPYPLHYFTAGVALCLVTQVVRYGHMLKVDLKNVRCTVEGQWTSEGSVFAGTIASKCHAMNIDLEIDSDDELPRVAALIRNAEGGCYAHAAVEHPVPVVSNAKVNGEPVDYEDFPRKVSRR